jgi:hypothetical protein
VPTNGSGDGTSSAVEGSHAPAIQRERESIAVHVHMPPIEAGKRTVTRRVSTERDAKGNLNGTVVEEETQAPPDMQH